MSAERIEAAAKLRYDRIHGEGSYDQLSVGEMVDLCDEIEASVSAWLEAGPPVYQEVCGCPDCPEVTKPESVVIQTSIGYMVEVKSDES